MRGALSCFILVLSYYALTVDAFSPAPRVLQIRPSWTVRSSPLMPQHSSFMESSLESENALVMEPVTASIPDVMEEQGARWNIDSFVNQAILFGVATLVLAKVTLIDSDVSRGWTAAEVIQHMPLSVWHSYTQVLTDSPVATKAVTSATVYMIGDVIAQQTEGVSIGELDRMRTLRSLLAGLIGHGPLSHVWYNASDNLFQNILHLTAWWSVIPKVAVDQFFWGPIWNNTYLLLLGLMKGDSPSNIWNDMKRTTVPLVLSGLKLWPLAHCVTYGLIPTPNRLLWVDLVEIAWVTILASSAAEAHSPPLSDKVLEQAKEEAPTVANR